MDGDIQDNMANIQEQQLHTLMINFKPTYLDQNGITVRQFSSISKITRGKLEKLFSGEIHPTTDEIVLINAAMNILKVKFERKRQAEEKKKFKAAIKSEMVKALGESTAEKMLSEKPKRKKVVTH
jgi:hypothetical protein